mmetsp:Transcript_4644/g.7043  ORF Transcript_4644/g.7043 Transcript_4644/m.7043 type:complete len:102 (+) Transcript_4644:3346-3651(+)
MDTAGKATTTEGGEELLRVKKKMSLSLSKSKKYKLKPKKDSMNHYTLLRKEANLSAELNGPQLNPENLHQLKRKLSTIKSKLNTNRSAADNSMTIEKKKAS